MSSGDDLSFTWTSDDDLNEALFDPELDGDLLRRYTKASLLAAGSTKVPLPSSHIPVEPLPCSYSPVPDGSPVHPFHHPPPSILAAYSLVSEASEALSYALPCLLPNQPSPSSSSLPSLPEASSAPAPQPTYQAVYSEVQPQLEPIPSSYEVPTPVEDSPQRTQPPAQAVYSEVQSPREEIPFSYEVPSPLNDSPQRPAQAVYSDVPTQSEEIPPTSQLPSQPTAKTPYYDALGQSKTTATAENYQATFPYSGNAMNQLSLASHMSALPDILNYPRKEAKAPEGKADGSRKRVRMSTIDWTGLFVHLMSIESEDQTQEMLRAQSLRALAHSFANVAKLVGSEIVRDRFRPMDEIKIPSIDAGGIAGGEKFIAKGIFFKFAHDVHGIYGGDRFAQKAVNHELKGLMALMKVKLDRPQTFQALHFPLFSHITYLGFRIIAMSLLPIGSRSLIYGSDDGGITVHRDVPAINEAMTMAGQLLNLSPHHVGLTSQIREMALCGDIEVHQSRADPSKYFVCDTARVFPPVRPEGGRNTCLFNLFRPEFLMRYPSPLSSDAFTGWGAHGRAEHDARVSEATQALRLAIDSYADSLQTGEAVGFADQQALVLDIHLHGINLRYLGRLFQRVTAAAAAKTRAMLLVELCARTFKAELLERLRGRGPRSPQEVLSASLDQFFATSPYCLPGLLVKHFFAAPSDAVVVTVEGFEAARGAARQRLLTLVNASPESHKISAKVKHVFLYDFLEAFSVVQLAAEKVGPAAVQMLNKGAALYQASLDVFPADSQSLHNYGICLFKLGREAFLRGNSDAAESFFARTAKVYERCGILNGPTNIHTFVSLGSLYMYWGEANDERYHELFTQAFASLETALTLPPVPLMPHAFVYDSWGLALKKYARKCEDMSSRDLAQITELVDRGVAVFQKGMAVAKVASEIACLCNNWGLLYKEHADRLHRGDLGGAQRALSEAVACYEQGLEKEELNIGLLLNLASAISLQASLTEDAEEADTLYAKAVLLYERVLELYDQEWQAPYNQAQTTLDRANKLHQGTPRHTELQLYAFNCFFRSYQIFPSQRTRQRLCTVGVELLQTALKDEFLGSLEPRCTGHIDGFLRSQLQTFVVQGTHDDPAKARRFAQQAITSYLKELLEEHPPEVDEPPEPRQQLTQLLLQEEQPALPALLGKRCLALLAELPRLSQGTYQVWRILRLLGHSDESSISALIQHISFDDVRRPFYSGTAILYEMFILVLLCVELPEGRAKFVHSTPLVALLFEQLCSPVPQLVSLAAQVITHLIDADSAQLLHDDHDGKVTLLLQGLLRSGSDLVALVLATLVQVPSVLEAVRSDPLFAEAGALFAMLTPHSPLVGTLFVPPHATSHRCPEQHMLCVSFFAEGGYAGGWCCDLCETSAQPSVPRLRCNTCSYDACLACCPVSQHQCGDGHPLSLALFTEGGYAHGWACDLCETSFPPSSHRWRCAPCSFDGCYACLSLQSINQSI